MVPGLESEGVNIANTALNALEDAELRSELLNGLRSKKDILRSNCFKVLHSISETNPRTVYPEWNFFATLLESDNAYHRLIAVRILANLTPADRENKFDALFDRYYNLLNDSVIVADILPRVPARLRRRSQNYRLRLHNGC